MPTFVWHKIAVPSATISRTKFQHILLNIYYRDAHLCVHEITILSATIDRIKFKHETTEHIYTTEMPTFADITTEINVWPTADQLHAINQT